MDFYELVKARYSVRKYADKPVEEEKLQKVLAAGASAPTAKNQQPQHVYVLESKEIEAEKPGRIVVGLALNMNGTEGPKALECREFAAQLQEKSGLEVVLWDERGSSVTANRILSDAGKKRDKQRARADAVAAQVILQSYLDFYNMQKNR